MTKKEKEVIPQALEDLQNALALSIASVPGVSQGLRKWSARTLAQISGRFGGEEPIKQAIESLEQAKKVIS